MGKHTGRAHVIYIILSSYFIFVIILSSSSSSSLLLYHYHYRYYFIIIIIVISFLSLSLSLLFYHHHYRYYLYFIIPSSSLSVQLHVSFNAKRNPPGDCLPTRSLMYINGNQMHRRDKANAELNRILPLQRISERLFANAINVEQP